MTRQSRGTLDRSIANALMSTLVLSVAVSASETAGHEVELPNVVLFPWFSMLIGVFAYYLISRYAHALPYTAIMFITGAMMGYLALYTHGNAVAETIRLWLGINGEVIILTFLPGLLFLDSYNINVYLFKKSFWQLVTFAFPMVLAGTTLTALVAYFVFPYGWSFDLCMTFGAILAATDPVAVAVLLNELGAPSRLKIHIAGESLMNDGSAVVFFHIFSSRFFHELGIEGFGEAIGWGRGFALFFRLSLGGACIGLAFGVGLVTLLFNFNRRLSKEENVIQVTTTIMTAYLSFYVSEILAGCSGIIAVVFCGITTKAFGETLINDSHLTEDFWHITEHLLNTTLFTLGGAVWGGVISSTTSIDGAVHYFGAMDWVYLLILFGLVIVIRFVLVFTFLPVTSRMGIGQNWKEALFMSWGGLRGAVGISLALLLSAEVFKYSESESVSEETMHQYREFTDKIFGMVGGIAFLTLIINGPTSGPLLTRLGLVTPTETRKKVVNNYEQHMRQNVLVEYMSLLGEKTFAAVDFGIVKEHVSPLSNVTSEELNAAVDTMTRRNPDKIPNIGNLMRYIHTTTNDDQCTSFSAVANAKGVARNIRQKASRLRHSQGDTRGTVYDFRTPLDKAAALEERQIFIDLLRREYHHQLDVGELDSRGFIPFSLLQSLQVADDAAARGLPLQDWDATQTLGRITRKGDKLLHAYRVGGLFNRSGGDEDFHAIRIQVLQALSFITAHLRAGETFKAEFASVDSQSLTLAEKVVLDESKDQISRADAAINAFDAEDVNAIKSQYVCQVLLYKSAHYFEKLSKNGLMTEREAGNYLNRYDIELRRLRLSSELKAEIGYLTQIVPDTNVELGRLDMTQLSESEEE
eukprot:g10446.t1 g10446   contig4:1896035-1898632(+)